MTRKIELINNPPSFKQHQDLPEDLRMPLDLMCLHYWPECRAVFCKACKADVKSWRNQKLCRDHVLPHLRRYHDFEDGLHLEVLSRCLDKLLELAKTPDKLLSPVPGLLPRDFLDPPINGWLCLMCGFATDDVRSSQSHFKIRHHAIGKLPPRQALVQHMDRDLFDVKGDLLKANVEIEKNSKEQTSTDLISSPDLSRKLVQETDNMTDILHFWTECYAFICKSCESRPILCRKAILNHIEEDHPDEEGFRDLEVLGQKLNQAEPFAQEPENIQLPGPWLGVQSFLQPPAAGYACSAKSCGYASKKLDDVKKHEFIAHPGETLQTGDRTKVMIQYVTLNERIYLPVLHFGDRRGATEKVDLLAMKKNDEGVSIPRANTNYQRSEDLNDYQKYLAELKQSAYAMDSICAINAKPISSDNMSVRSGVSAISGMTTTHRSLFHRKGLEDAYTTKQRFDVLTSLWDTPTEEDLHPLNDSEVQKKVRKLALRDEDQAINQVKRFDSVFRQALLYTQHEIIIIEEALSKGTHVPSHILRQVLMEYSEYS